MMWLLLLIAVATAVAYVGYRRRRAAALVPRFAPATHHAVRTLQDPRSAAAVFDACGLSIGGIAPRVISVQPAPWGASVQLALVIGQSAKHFEDATGRLCTALACERVQVRARFGQVTLDLVTEDPLAQPISVEGVPKGEPGRIILGISEAALPVTFSLVNLSAMVVAGIPGSGKTSAMRTWFGSLVSRPEIQFMVLDGKGSGDWDWLRPRCFSYMSTDADLESVAAELESIQLLMSARFRRLPDEFDGQSNLWDGGPSDEWPVVIVIIDEAQSFFVAQSNSKQDKEVAERISQCVGRTVRKQRSAGLVTVISTQRPTADSIPTIVRDNAERKVGFALRSVDAEKATFGELLDPAGPRPTELHLPGDAGVCITTDNGEYVRLRVPQVDTRLLSRWVEHHVGLTRDPRQLVGAGSGDGSVDQ